MGDEVHGQWGTWVMGYISIILHRSRWGQGWWGTWGIIIWYNFEMHLRSVRSLASQSSEASKMRSNIWVRSLIGITQQQGRPTMGLYPYSSCYLTDHSGLDLTEGGQGGASFPADPSTGPSCMVLLGMDNVGMVRGTCPSPNLGGLGIKRGRTGWGTHPLHRGKTNTTENITFHRNTYVVGNYWFDWIVV